MLQKLRNLFLDFSSSTTLTALGTIRIENGKLFYHDGSGEKELNPTIYGGGGVSGGSFQSVGDFTTSHTLSATTLNIVHPFSGVKKPEYLFLTTQTDVDRTRLWSNGVAIRRASDDVIFQTCTMKSFNNAETRSRNGLIYQVGQAMSPPPDFSDVLTGTVTAMNLTHVIIDVSVIGTFGGGNVILKMFVTAS